MSFQLPEWMKSSASTLFVAIVVGIASAYMTVQVQKEQIEENRRRISALETKQQSMTSTQADVRERLVRLETKIDLLLTGQDEMQ